MGFARVNVKIKGKDEIELKDVLVDTGASFTVLPIEIAEKYYIETPFEVEFRKVKAKVFVAEVEIEGRKGSARILAFENAIPVVGVGTLEMLGLKVDPATRKIEKQSTICCLYEKACCI